MAPISNAHPGSSNHSVIVEAVEGLNKALRSRRESAGNVKSPSSPSTTSGSPAQGGSLTQALANCCAKIMFSSAKKPRIEKSSFTRIDGISVALSPATSSDFSCGDLDRTTSLPGSPAVAAVSPSSDSNQRSVSVPGGSSRPPKAISLGPPPPQSPSAPPAARNGMAAAPVAKPKTVRRRSRVSKKPPTHTVLAEPENFLATVQSLTGCPATASRINGPGLHGPLPSNLRRENRDLGAGNSQAKGLPPRPSPLHVNGARDLDNLVRGPVQPAVRFETLSVSDTAPALPLNVAQSVQLPAPQPSITPTRDPRPSLLNSTFGYESDNSFMTLFDQILESGDLGLSDPPTSLNDHCLYSQHPSDVPPRMSPDMYENSSHHPHELSFSPGSELDVKIGSIADGSNMNDMARGSSTARNGDCSHWFSDHHIISPPHNEHRGPLDPHYDRHFFQADFNSDEDLDCSGMRVDQEVNSWIYQPGGS